MTYRWLRVFRTSVAVVFIILIGLAFIDFTGLFPDKLMKGTLWIQFVPSLLKFSRVLTFSALGFAVILLITLLFGRFYCASICPLGILQDVILRITRRFKKIRFKYQKPINWVRHFLLGFTVLTVLTGSMLVVNLIDPYSVFGRIFSDLLRPMVTAGNNMLAWIFQSMDIYTFYYVDIHPLNWTIYLVPVIFLFVISYLTVIHGRIYCNTICPVGTLLGYLSKISVFKIRINENNCTNCKLCERACKAECIDLENQEVDHSRCIACFNCLTSCKFNAIDFTPKKQPKAELAEVATPENPARRKALNLLIGGAFVAPASTVAQNEPQNEPQKGPKVYKGATKPVKREQYVTPPGSGDVKEFLNKCTACHLCVSACPTQVIQPAKDQFGWDHIMQVRMDFIAGFCNYECVRCTEVCPTGALLPLEVEKKKLTQLGKVKFVKENCVVEAEGTDCGACDEVCPTKAVYMVPYKNGLRIPETNDKICIGCGACENACPTLPYKAIYVEGNKEHVMAEKPKEEKAEKPDHEGDFPF